MKGLLFHARNGTVPVELLVPAPDLVAGRNFSLYAHLTAVGGDHVRFVKRSHAGDFAHYTNSSRRRRAQRHDEVAAVHDGGLAAVPPIEAFYRDFARSIGLDHDPDQALAVVANNPQGDAGGDELSRARFIENPDAFGDDAAAHTHIRAISSTP